MTLMAIPTTLVTIGIMGLVADHIKPVFLIAPAFLARSAVCFTFKIVDDASSPAAYTVSSLLLATSTVLVISLESLFMKNLPRDIRGAMTILLTFFLGLGSLCFNGIGGLVFDGFGPASPFVVVSGLDLVVFVMAVLLGCAGHLDYGKDNTKDLCNKEVLNPASRDIE